MKSLILAFLFLAAIITGSLASTYFITNQADLLSNDLIELERHVDSENWEKVTTLYKDLKRNWSKVDHKWSMLIDHYEIDYINMDLGELEAYIKVKDKTNALAKLSSLQRLVDHIPEKEYPSLKNIF